MVNIGQKRVNLIKTKAFSYLQSHQPSYFFSQAEQLPKLSPSRHNSLSMYLFLDSEPWLGKSKELNNQGMKIHSKELYKSFFFVTQKKVDRLCMKFSSIPNTSVQPQPTFSKFSTPYSVASFFFEKYLNPQVSIDKMINEGSAVYHLNPSRLTLKGSSSHVFIDLLEFYLSLEFLNLL